MNDRTRLARVVVEQFVRRQPRPVALNKRLSPALQPLVSERQRFAAAAARSIS